MKDYKTAMTTRKACELMRRLPHLFGDGTLGVADRFDCGEPVRGQKTISFTPYVHPHKTPEANAADLLDQAPEIVSVFPDYTPPTVAEISRICAGRAAMMRSVMAEAASAELGGPSGAESFLSNITN
jgi:hypothetical protein